MVILPAHSSLRSMTFETSLFFNVILYTKIHFLSRYTDVNDDFNILVYMVIKDTIFKPTVKKFIMLLGSSSETKSRPFSKIRKPIYD